MSYRRMRPDWGAANRERVRAAVRGKPGLCFREVARASGLAAGTVAHHLRMLKKRGEVSECQLGHRRLFFPSSSPLAPRDALLLREPALTAIRDWVAANPGRPQKDLLEAMAPTAHSVTQHRLKRLVAARVVDERHVGGRRHALHLATAEHVPGLGLMPASMGHAQGGVASHREVTA